MKVQMLILVLLFSGCLSLGRVAETFPQVNEDEYTEAMVRILNWQFEYDIMRGW